MPTVIIRGGLVLVAGRFDTPLRADLLIENGKIARIERSIDSDADEVIDATGKYVAPGFIDTHRHNWESVLRNARPNADFADYSVSVMAGFGAVFEPQDVYASGLLGALGAIDAGITTLVDISHIGNSRAHIDGAIQSLVDSGIRPVYAPGLPMDNPSEWIGWETTRRAPTETRSVVADWEGTGLLTFTLGVRGPEFSSYEVSWDDYRFGRELGLRLSVHTGTGSWAAHRQSVTRTAAEGLLGPDVTFVHCNSTTDAELRMIADSGATISSSPICEVQMGCGSTSFARFRKAGLTPSLSTDVEAMAGGDLFGVARAAFQFARMEAHLLREGGEDAPLPTVEEVLDWATLQGARAIGMEDRIGSIEVGKSADVIVLDLARFESYPVSSAAGAILQSTSRDNVTHVLVEGKVLKRDGALVGVDLEKVKRDAGAALERITARNARSSASRGQEAVSTAATRGHL